MRHGIAEALLLVGCLLLAIGSLMLVSTSHAATPDCESTVTSYEFLEKTSCNARGNCLADNKSRACIAN